MLDKVQIKGRITPDDKVNLEVLCEKLELWYGEGPAIGQLLSAIARSELQQVGERKILVLPLEL